MIFWKILQWQSGSLLNLIVQMTTRSNNSVLRSQEFGTVFTYGELCYHSRGENSERVRSNMRNTLCRDIILSKTIEIW